jgi:hypothetical protein
VKRYTLGVDPYRRAAPGEPPPAGAPVDLGVLRSRHATRFGAHGVEVHAHGLVVIERNAERRLRFDAIDELWIVPSSGALEAVVLVDFERARTALSAKLPDFAQILATLDREVVGPLEREAKAALARGERLVFGPIALTRERVEGPGWSHAVRELRLVRLVLKRLVLLHGELTLDAVELAKIPHPTLFVRLLEHLSPRTEGTGDGVDLVDL